MKRMKLTGALALVGAVAALIDTPYPPEGTGLVALSVLVAPATDDGNGIPGVTFTSDRSATSYFLNENEFPSLELLIQIRPFKEGAKVDAEVGEELFCTAFG